MPSAPAAIVARLDRALATADDGDLRAELTAHSGLPGARLNLRLVDEFAAAVGATAARPEPPVDALEALLDGWAAISPADAPGDQPAVMLVAAAMAAYGAVGEARPEWWSDETAKLRRGAGDSRWRVREAVARALQRLLDADWSRTSGALLAWAGDDDPLVVRAAVAAVAEPRLLRDPARAARAQEIQAAAVTRFRAWPPERRRASDGRVLRQALGFTISVTTAATEDFALLRDLASWADADGRWIVAENRTKARLRRWPEELAQLDR